MLSTTQVAEELGIVSSTVRAWGTELAAILSEDANPPRGQKRVYTEGDLAIFRKARVLRADGHSWEEVVEAIQAKEGDTSHQDGESGEQGAEAVEGAKGKAEVQVEAEVVEGVETADGAGGEPGAPGESEEEDGWPDNSDEVVPGTIFDVVMRQISARTDDLRADLEDEREQHEATRERLRDAELRATAAEIEAKMLKAQLEELKATLSATKPWWQVWRRSPSS